MSETTDEERIKFANDDGEYTCYHQKDVGRSSLCYPAHRCDLPEGHEGVHVCNCGVRFRKSSNLGED